MRTRFSSYLYSMILRTVALFLLIFSMGKSLLMAQTFDVSISQGGHDIPIEKNAVYLKKEPFVFHFKLNELEGVFLNCNRQAIIAYGAKNNKISNLQKIGYMVGAEDPFNPDQDLIIHGNHSYSYWYYDPSDPAYKFDSVISVQGSSVLATRSVKQFYEDGKNIPVSLMSEKLYLTVFAVSRSILEANAKLEQVLTLQLIFED